MINKVKILLLAAIIPCCFISCRQAKHKPDYFVGYWSAYQTTAQIVIFKDTANRFQMVSWDNSSGKAIRIFMLEFANDTIKTKEIFNNWVTNHRYTLVNDSEMDDKISSSDGTVIVHYARIK